MQAEVECCLVVAVSAAAGSLLRVAAGTVAAHLRYAHEGWHNAVHVSTAISERLLLAALPVDCLQRLIQRLELECGLLLGQLQGAVCQQATVLEHYGSCP